MTDLSTTPRTQRGLPVGTGLATVASAMMVVGACSPWIGARLFGSTTGVGLGGDGWLVVAAACLAVLSLLLPLPRCSAIGLWVVVLSIGAGYVCWIHVHQAGTDGFEIVWGLDLSAAGSALLAAAGLRLLRP